MGRGCHGAPARLRGHVLLAHFSLRGRAHELPTAEPGLVDSGRCETLPPGWPRQQTPCRSLGKLRAPSSQEGGIKSCFLTPGNMEVTVDGCGEPVRGAAAGTPAQGCKGLL